jgi:hypothetical protein
MRLFEGVFQALYAAYRVALALYRGVDLFWSVIVTAVGYTVGVVLRLIFIVAIEGGALYGTWWLLRRQMFFGAFFGFVAAETLVVVIGFDLLWTVLTFQFARVLGSDEFGKQDQDGYSPLGGDSPEDAPDPLSF